MYNSPIGLVIFQDGSFPLVNSSKLLSPKCLKGGEKPFKEKSPLSFCCRVKDTKDTTKAQKLTLVLHSLVIGRAECFHL